MAQQAHRSIAEIGAIRPAGPGPETPQQQPPPQQPAKRAEAAPAAPTAEERRQALADAVTDALDLQPGRLVIEPAGQTGRFIYKIVDPRSGDVIRQWPREEWLELARKHGETRGLIVDRNA
jgi:flagellar protein FlaG